MSVVNFFCVCLWSLFGVFGIEFVSVMEGDRVIMNLNETQRNDGIKWKFGPTEIVVAEIIEGDKIIKDERPDGRFRDRLQLNKDTGSLTITNISITHTGLYQITSSKTQRQINAFNITVYARLPVPVITRNSLQCSSCVLSCSVMDVSHVTLSWYKGNSLVSNISVSDLHTTVSIHLVVEYQDTNTYSCVINNTISNQTQYLIADDCQLCSVSGYILYLSCAAGSLMIIITALLMYCICRKHRKTNQEDQTDEQEITYADPTFYKGHKPRSAAVEEDVVYAGVMRR